LKIFITAKANSKLAELLSLIGRQSQEKNGLSSSKNLLNHCIFKHFHHETTPLEAKVNAHYKIIAIVISCGEIIFLKDLPDEGSHNTSGNIRT
jgi:hypothetical protein